MCLTDFKHKPVLIYLVLISKGPFHRLHVAFRDLWLLLIMLTPNVVLYSQLFSQNGASFFGCYSIVDP